VSLPGYSGGFSLYKTTGIYRGAGTGDSGAPLLDVSPAQAPSCPFGQQSCGVVGDIRYQPWAEPFCCPVNTVCCDETLPFSLRCCPLGQPDCCHQGPGPGDGNGDPVPTHPRCPPGREHCGDHWEGNVRVQDCCPPGTKCCNPDTGFCCPEGAINCCRRATETSGHVDLCCDPDTAECAPPGNCCLKNKSCTDRNGARVCCSATQTCTTLDGCCDWPRMTCGGAFNSDHCCDVSQACCNGVCTDITTTANCGSCTSRCPPGQICCPNPLPTALPRWQCIDPLTSSTNCGVCGHQCNMMNPHCSNGHCVPNCMEWRDAGHSYW
jgi:hypothetical protein